MYYSISCSIYSKSSKNNNNNNNKFMHSHQNPQLNLLSSLPSSQRYRTKPSSAYIRFLYHHLHQHQPQQKCKGKKHSNATLDVIDFCYLLFIQSRSDNNSGNAQHPYWRVQKSFLSSYESFKLSLLSLLEPINLNSRKKRKLSSNSYLVVLCN